MPSPAPPPHDPGARGETAGQILDIAETLIQTRGYSAISYHDIAQPLGIRKASIHYHFPSKADLGVAVVERYARRFAEALAAVEADESRPAMAMLDAYVEPYLEFARTPERVCLCGALAGELMALPPAMRARVEAFFAAQQEWIARMLARGRRRGELALPADPARTARMVFGALQGALIVKRTTGDVSQMSDVVEVLKAQLSPVGAAKKASNAGARRHRAKGR
ncbi:MAG: TetR/AcrR family transcriptional regulator [Alphaproteobacteria bacterium]|nr:TetR/AcrR family transcriptional regulator [Alphaproteobacteria bacterium]